VTRARVLRTTHVAAAPQTDDITQRLLHRRAIEAALWGMPIVSFDAMRQAFLRDAGAKYNDIVFWSSKADWQLQIATPNASTHYVFIAINTKGGPLVLEIPPAVGAGLFGSICDAWQTPVIDVGPQGADEGKGGRYVLLPPGYTDAVPADLIQVRMNTYGGYCVLRAIPASSSADDVAKAMVLVQETRMYLVAQSEGPPVQYHIDMSDRMFDGIVRFDETFYGSLSRMINEEPVQPRDLVAMGQLRSIGIERGNVFHPDEAMLRVLRSAIAETHELLMQAATRGMPYWPESRWITPGEGIGPKTAFSFELDDRLEVDERAMTFFLACAPPKKLGAASFYLFSAHDANHEPLDGGKSYRLRVPAHVPASQFWATTVYDLSTAAFIRESPRVELNSFDEDIERRSDGSVDVYFGPTPPDSGEANWVCTTPGKPWLVAFRFYGPQPALFEKTWRLGDLEPM
jgi:hypothetical protein